MVCRKLNLFTAVFIILTSDLLPQLWVPDVGDGNYKNPIIFADYSDPDVIRVDNNYYMVSSSFNCTPVMPVLHSNDLVNWTIIGYVSQNLPDSVYNMPQHGRGCWAPSIRFHKGEFYVYYGDPDFGIYMSKTKNPSGSWEPLHLAKRAKGWIDPCPLWDDDGNAYLVHAWAKSRAGFNGILTVRKMSTDGKRVYDDSVNVFDGRKNHPTIEGPKFYKRNGYYYIFAPAGGVTYGWQTVLRSRNVYGPYEDRIVMNQGRTPINGPHQGGWIETQTGESWFIHFQDRGAYGRVVHLQPVQWNNDWPVIGIDYDGNGIGEPVLFYRKPDVGAVYTVSIPQTSDEFDSASLGLQWQWHANFRKEWYCLGKHQGHLRLYCVWCPSVNGNLWLAPNLLLQKFPAPSFSATAKLLFCPESDGDKTGLVIMGKKWAYIALTKKGDCLQIGMYEGNYECGNDTIKPIESRNISTNMCYLKVEVDSNAQCSFYYSTNGKDYLKLGRKFMAVQGVWIGAKVGLFSITTGTKSSNGYADYDWFRIE